MTKRKKWFYVSASQLSQYYQCPARYAFSRRYKPVAPDPWWLQDGNDAHAVMAGDDVEELQPSARALRLVESAQQLVSARYDVLGTEVEQVFPITPVIKLQRKLDAIAKDNKGPVILDYKFVGRPWNVIPHTGYGPMAPKASGIQSKCYLYPPPTKLNHFNIWPSRIHYIVASDDDIKVHEYITRPGDQKTVQNASRALKAAWDKQWMPKMEGFLCHTYCDKRAVCFEEPAWQDEYEEIKNDPYRLDVRYRS
jgi:hypothetical protein